MFGDWTKGFWVSSYHGRVPDAPSPSMRVMTSAVPDGVVVPDDVPHFRGRPSRFLVKLLTTWAAMGFRKPRIAGVAD